jgi:hypothetical protein
MDTARQLKRAVCVLVVAGAFLACVAASHGYTIFRDDRDGYGNPIGVVIYGEGAYSTYYLYCRQNGFVPGTNFNNLYLSNSLSGPWYSLSSPGGGGDPSNVGFHYVGDGGNNLVMNWYYQWTNGTAYFCPLSDSTYQEFKYDFLATQWSGQGKYGGWAQLGVTGLDAGLASWSNGDLSSRIHYVVLNWYYDIGDGWWFKGPWQFSRENSDNPLFSYNITTGQWHSIRHNYDIGAAQMSASFLGDGAWHDLGSWDGHWAFQYTGAASYWKSVALDLIQLKYDYTADQWLHQGTTNGWAPLSVAAQNIDAFVGDGLWHIVYNNWLYKLDSGTGYWSPWVTDRFTLSYNYATSQWYDESYLYPGWAALGTAGLSATFMGDGSWHDLQTGWSYMYSFSTGWGQWKFTSLNQVLFEYYYGTGQWQHQGSSGGWINLGSYHKTAAFMGDGSWYDLGSGWSYQFGGGFGGWKNASLNLTQFAYDYGASQWYDEGLYGGWATLGTSGLSAAFLGDGSVRSLGNNWNYQYAGGFATFKDTLLNWTVFAYDYSGGRWYDQGKTGGWSTLGATNLSAWFVGDGSVRDIGNQWYYQYGGGFGIWTNVPLNLNQFAYAYNTGQWYDEGFYGGWATLGSTGQSSWFVGDGTWHGLGTLGDGNWYFNYTPGSVWGSFMNPVAGRAYIYDYNAGQMYYWNGSTWTPTGPNHYPPVFGG